MMPPVFAMGRVTGTADALAIEYGDQPRNVPALQLQEILVRQGTHLGKNHELAAEQ
ncbi:hypothetical protein BH23CHL4_BH23CHL4_12180 [soil metagenome]